MVRKTILVLFVLAASLGTALDAEACRRRRCCYTCQPACQPVICAAPSCIVAPEVVVPEKVPVEPKVKEKAMLSGSATIVVSLPADARLFIDGTSTTSTSNRRVFTTPQLAPGTIFQYTLQAEVVRDGQTVHLTRTVPVQAYQTTQVNLDLASFTLAAR